MCAQPSNQSVRREIEHAPRAVRGPKETSHETNYFRNSYSRNTNRHGCLLCTRIRAVGWRGGAYLWNKNSVRVPRLALDLGQPFGGRRLETSACAIGQR